MTYDGTTAVRKTDGGYVLLGSTRYFNAANNDIWLSKIDENASIGNCPISSVTSATAFDTTATLGGGPPRPPFL